MKKVLAKDQDKFVVRLPAGMRERIRGQADRFGMSMNEAIVWCLEQYFPAPATLDERLAELAELTAMLKSGTEPHEAVERLIKEMHQTLSEVASGRLESPVDLRSAVREHLDAWSERKAEEAAERQHNLFDAEGLSDGEWELNPAIYGKGDLDDGR